LVLYGHNQIVIQASGTTFGIDANNLIIRGNGILEIVIQMTGGTGTRAGMRVETLVIDGVGGAYAGGQVSITTRGGADGIIATGTGNAVTIKNDSNVTVTAHDGGRGIHLWNSEFIVADGANTVVHLHGAPAIQQSPVINNGARVYTTNVWNANFRFTGGTYFGNNHVAITNIPDGGAVTNVPTPVRMGHVFERWASQIIVAGNTVNVDMTPDSIDENVDFTAVWQLGTEDAFTVTCQGSLLAAIYAAGTEPTEIVLEGVIDTTQIIRIPTGSNITLSGDGTINNVAPGGGRVVEVMGTSNLTIDGITITGGTGGGAGLFVDTNATVTMYSGYITGNTNTAQSGGVMVSGTFIMNGGEITNNTSGQNGGGVHVANNGTFIMNDGLIYGNGANNGGGVHATGANASFIMNGGVVAGNTATNNGDDVNGDFEHNGGYVGEFPDEPTDPVPTTPAPTTPAPTTPVPTTPWPMDPGDSEDETEPSTTAPHTTVASTTPAATQAPTTPPVTDPVEPTTPPQPEVVVTSPPPLLPPPLVQATQPGIRLYEGMAATGGVEDPFRLYTLPNGYHVSMFSFRAFAYLADSYPLWCDFTRTATLIAFDTDGNLVTIVVTEGSTTAEITRLGVTQTIDIAYAIGFRSGPYGSIHPLFLDERIFLPLRFFAEMLGFEVHWYDGIVILR